MNRQEVAFAVLICILLLCILDAIYELTFLLKISAIGVAKRLDSAHTNQTAEGAEAKE